MSSPNLGSTQSDGLDGVGCINTAFCMAGGAYNSGVPGWGRYAA